MKSLIKSYIPERSEAYVFKLLEKEHLIVKIKNERKTRHGDYRKMPNGKHQITINSNLNQYRFLITLIHEIAHLEAFIKYGNIIKPHGLEWKRTFQHLMLPLINPEVFPNKLLPLIAKHFINPKASSDTDTKLAYALQQFDEPNGKYYVFQLSFGATFKLYNGRVFRKGKKRVKRFECEELITKKLYLFNPNTEVELLIFNKEEIT